MLSLPPAALNSPKLEFYSCKFDWTNQCTVDQSKCIFKVVVSVFDVERKCHGGTPQLSYITGGGGGGHHMWFFRRLPTATQCQNLRIHIILLAGKYFFNLVPSRLFHSVWAEPIIRWAKTGDPREKPPDRPQAELCLSHMWPELGSNPQRWDKERFRLLKVSGLNHSATGATGWQIAIFFFAKMGGGVGGGTQTPEISKVRNSISYDSLDHSCAFLFIMRKRKKKPEKKWSQEPVCGGALGRRWGGGEGGRRHSN